MLGGSRSGSRRAHCRCADKCAGVLRSRGIRSFYRRDEDSTSESDVHTVSNREAFLSADGKADTDTNFAT